MIHVIITAALFYIAWHLAVDDDQPEDRRTRAHGGATRRSGTGPQ